MAGGGSTVCAAQVLQVLGAQRSPGKSQVPDVRDLVLNSLVVLQHLQMQQKFLRQGCSG